MSINDFIKQFIEAVEIVDASTVTENTKFRDLDEWCSMSTLGIIDLADEEYGVELSADVLRKAQTVKDLFNVIQSLK